MAFDIISPVKLGQLALTASAQTVYTVPSLARAIVKTIDICNTNSSNVTVTVYLVPSGGSANNATTLIPGPIVVANGMFQWSGAQVLSEGDTIRAVASTTGVTINVSGAECV